MTQVTHEKHMVLSFKQGNRVQDEVRILIKVAEDDRFVFSAAVGTDATLSCSAQQGRMPGLRS
ncbi:hypothetical protein H6P81_011155 [Aristolochia fimbriata]|uniref:Uncharacterized protein n=1 Tax=Aristolochia fimbriata TaxID=158543 RepID=A0AAV7EQQ2_ARIFI|nr:hypothetical protein H6P81_011155 [Aristolochia fimbriata]